MTGALIILCATILTGLLLFITHKKEKDADMETPHQDPAADSCCGRHVVCEKTAAIPFVPEYFDDEELDRFAGRGQDKYDSTEIEEFRDVLYTLLPEDVYPWGVSLTARNIALPEELRDEWIMLCREG